ncbi:MAG: hypothetical protein MK052_04700 [Alphaproteobacteria bacterium]|nr:hypothetical protein [Alphaproteobacteria bacterium]
MSKSTKYAFLTSLPILAVMVVTFPMFNDKIGYLLFILMIAGTFSTASWMIYEVRHTKELDKLDAWLIFFAVSLTVSIPFIQWMIETS